MDKRFKPDRTLALGRRMDMTGTARHELKFYISPSDAAILEKNLSISFLMMSTVPMAFIR